MTSRVWKVWKSSKRPPSQQEVDRIERKVERFEAENINQSILIGNRIITIISSQTKKKTHVEQETINWGDVWGGPHITKAFLAGNNK
ncbi:unnamed protein product [Nippostrongylus brasiliensis]|uniref:Reverse transcriptase domain-containing protein n=1 Tax=Nippostrongylus brasiliensis TaxID=27835 RepID=A0A0N4Y915_NIPBR|nr:unnamed protein product [Nippostrongylus brasiliensis]